MTSVAPAELVASLVEVDMRHATAAPQQDLQSCLASRDSRVMIARQLGQYENDALLRDCQVAIAQGPSSRSLDCLLSTPAGKLTCRPYNEVVCAFVEAITDVNEPGSQDARKARDFRRQVCIESLHSARHLKYVSNFFMSLQAVAYAISSSKTVVDMIGHLGPGCSYNLLKDWLQEMASEPVVVPSGFVTVSFDNEQRLLKNWLARGSNRSAIDVLTNIVCAVHDTNSTVQSNPSFHRRHWQKPSADDLLSVFNNADTLSCDRSR